MLKLSSAAVTTEDQTFDFSTGVAAAQKMGLRMVMTLIPIAVLVVAFIWFRTKYKLTDKKVEELAEQVAELHK